VRLKKLGKSNYFIWNRTGDPPACSIVPQPTTLTRNSNLDQIRTFSRVRGSETRCLESNRCVTASYIEQSYPCAWLDQVSERAGLKINILRTKEMRINPKSFTPLRVQGKKHRKCGILSYLGSTNNEGGGTLKDMKFRIGKTNAVFMQLYPV
jgi:hypothetical protein